MIRLSVLNILLIFCLFNFTGCQGVESGENGAVSDCIRRYNRLLADGYRSFNMTPVQEVATEEQATKLYFHLAAMSEGNLKMDSTLKKMEFIKTDLTKPDAAAVETSETWDFTHIDMRTGKKFAEERDFIYRMNYLLNKRNGRWIITGVTTVSGTSTNTVIAWPKIDRKGGHVYPTGNMPPNSAPTERR